MPIAAIPVVMATTVAAVAVCRPVVVMGIVVPVVVVTVNVHMDIIVTVVMMPSVAVVPMAPLGLGLPAHGHQYQRHSRNKKIRLHANLQTGPPINILSSYVPIARIPELLGNF